MEPLKLQSDLGADLRVRRIESDGGRAAGNWVEWTNPGEPPPCHPNLAPVQETMSTDGVNYWFVATPQGIPMVDVISEGPREGHLAVEITAALGHALARLVAWGVAPRGIIKHLYWCEAGIVLDWAGALNETDAELPRAKELGDAERLAVTIAAVLHGLLSGKSPLEAPHIFLPIIRFGHVQSQDLQHLLDTGLSGAATLDDLLQLLDACLAGARLTYAFSPHVTGFSSEGSLVQEVPGTKAPRSDWLLRLLFWGVGVFILLKYA